jgi:putative transposase
MRGHVIVGVMTISTDVDKLSDTDLTHAAWALIASMLPAARPGGRPRKINIRAALNAIFYLLRTGCQWRLLPREFPDWSTVYHYFQAWKNAGVWTCIQRSMYQTVPASRPGRLSLEPVDQELKIRLGIQLLQRACISVCRARWDLESLTAREWTRQTKKH